MCIPLFFPPLNGFIWYAGVKVKKNDELPSCQNVRLIFVFKNQKLELIEAVRVQNHNEAKMLEGKESRSEEEDSCVWIIRQNKSRPLLKSKVIFVLGGAKSGSNKENKQMKVSVSRFFLWDAPTLFKLLWVISLWWQEGQKSNLTQIWCNLTPRDDKAEPGQGLSACGD